MITLHSVVVATKDQISTEIGDEAVILNLGNGVYYGLNPLAVYVWNRIREPRAVDAICEDILAEYNVERERCANDLLNLLNDLAAHQLIEVADSADHAN